MRCPILVYALLPSDSRFVAQGDPGLLNSVWRLRCCVVDSCVLVVLGVLEWRLVLFALRCDCVVHARHLWSYLLRLDVRASHGGLEGP